MKFTFTLLRTLVLGYATIAQSQDLESKKESARQILLQFFEEEKPVGMAVSLSLKDSIIWSEGLGFSDLEGQSPIDPSQSLFRIASLSKPITSAILARMMEEGLLDYDQSVYAYVPDFPSKKYDISLRDLAMHRSGIRHYRWYEGENRKDLSIEEGLKKFSRSRLSFEPGTQYQYSSYGYNLLGHAMEKAANQSFELLLQNYLTNPLGMQHTLLDPAEYSNLKTSGFFRSNGKGKNKEEKYVNMKMKGPSGGILSTSEDLVRFGNAFIYKRLLKAETQAELLELKPLKNGNTVSYAMGWGVSKDAQGRTYYSHTGGNAGSVCRIIVYPEEELVLAVVSNTFGTDYLKFIRSLAAISNTLLDTE